MPVDQMFSTLPGLPGSFFDLKSQIKDNYFPVAWHACWVFTARFTIFFEGVHA
jgi:hypothetical protein